MPYNHLKARTATKSTDEANQNCHCLKYCYDVSLAEENPRSTHLTCYPPELRKRCLIEFLISTTKLAHFFNQTHRKPIFKFQRGEV